MIEVALTFRLKSEGGRQIPDGILSDYRYRPHIVIGSPAQTVAIIADGNHLTENYLGIAFVTGPEHIELGRSCIAQAVLMGWPAPEYLVVQVGATFTLREGPRIVGHGAISRCWMELS